MTAAEPSLSSHSTDLAWAAGLFDGEGCFHKRPDSRRTWAASLEMTDTSTVDRFHELVGVGGVRNKRRRNANWKDLRQWQATGRPAFVVAQMLEPYMVTKRDRARAIIRDWQEREAALNLICSECGTPFRSKNDIGHRPRVYCSERCRQRDRDKGRVRINGKRVRTAFSTV